MEKDDQSTLVNRLCMGIALQIGEAIEGGKIPPEWDGHELRALISDKAAQDASISTIRKNPRHARAKAYKNTVIINNL